MTQSCENCRFWNQDGIKDKVMGFCHRFPPTMDWQNPILDGLPECGLHVCTHQSDWCGEWQGKEPDTTQEAEEFLKKYGPIHNSLDTIAQNVQNEP